MKRLIIAAITLSVTVFFALWGNLYIKNSLNELIEVSKRDDYEIYDLWQEKKEKLSIMLKHEDVDEVTEVAENMKFYLEDGNTEEAENSKIKITSLLDSILQGEKPNMGNIF